MRKEDFDRAIGASPPPTVDIDRVIARERRRAWLRVSPVVTAAAAIVAITFGAITFAAPGDIPVLAEPTQSYCPGNAPTVPQAPENPDVAASRLTAALKTAVLQRAVAGTKLEQNPAAEYPKGTPHGPLEFFHIALPAQPRTDGCSGGSDHLEARATLVNGTTKGNVWAVIGRLGGDVTPASGCVPVQTDGEESCAASPGPNGETIVTRTLRYGPVRTHRVEVTKPDGTGVTLVTENVATNGKTETVATSADPPLTTGQLTEIALLPAMTLYP